MSNCPPTLKHSVDPGSFPHLLSSRDACSSAQQEGWLQGQAPRSHWTHRSVQQMHGGNDEVHPYGMPRHISLEGPYSSITDINIIDTTGYHTLTGRLMLRHPRPPSGLQGPSGERILGCPGFVVGGAWSTAACEGQSQPSVTPAQLQWHEQARF